MYKGRPHDHNEFLSIYLKEDLNGDESKSLEEDLYKVSSIRQDENLKVVYIKEDPNELYFIWKYEDPK